MDTAIKASNSIKARVKSYFPNNLITEMTYLYELYKIFDKTKKLIAGVVSSIFHHHIRYLQRSMQSDNQLHLNVPRI